MIIHMDWIMIHGLVPIYIILISPDYYYIILGELIINNVII